MEGWHGVTPKKLQNYDVEKVKIISRTETKNVAESFLNGYGVIPTEKIRKSIKQTSISHTISKNF